MTDPSVEPSGAGEEPAPPSVVRPLRVPRYRAFGLSGALIGVIAGVILATSRPADDGFSLSTIVGYFATALGLIGTLIGLGAAVLVERTRR